MKKKNAVILIVVILLIIIGLILFRFMNKVTLYSDSHTVGNTSGNLLNGGLFCEMDDTIYFANPYDQNMLYSMDSDLSHIKKVSSDNVSYINGSGKYLFYTKRNDQKKLDSDSFMALQSTGLYRMNINTKSIGSLYNDPTQVATLYGNNVFYQHYDMKKGLLLYSSKIDGSSDKKLLNEQCAPYVLYNDEIYYTGTNSDHSIHKLSANGGESTVVFDGNFTGLSRQGDYLYFLDMNDNYSLKRIKIDGSNFETLVSEQIVTYNVSPKDEKLFCQIDNQKDNGLYEFDLNSHKLTLVAAGNFNHLHFTSNYLFYETYDQSDLYTYDLTTMETKKLQFTK